MTLLQLRVGPLGVDLAPRSGGSIARFTVDDVDILRPMAAADVASGRGNNSASYPLVPFSNRIREGRVSFDGREITLAPNWPGQRHPMHGDGWAAAWEVVGADERSARISYLHDGASGWPFRYRASFAFRLSASELAVDMRLENLEAHAVPAGIGLHPFFVRDSDTTLACRTDSVWREDAELLPTERVALPPEWDFSAPRRVDAVPLDNCFDGWDGHATIVWPRRRLRLQLEATEPFRHLVIYTPLQRPFFCVEPVSHANGAIAETRLASGATLSGTVVFKIMKL